MHTFVIFLAWAVVSGASAWSSSEVSCGSCGSECQKACGTRNFRACCFNFQRRRRSQTPTYSLKGSDDSESMDVHLILRPPTERGQESIQLPHIIRFFSRNGDDSLKSNPSLLKDYQLLHSISPAFLQESSEEVDEEVNDLTPSQGVVEGRSLGFGETGGAAAAAAEDEALNLLEMAYRRSPQIALHRRQIRQTQYPQSPSKIRK